jgi:diadenosine tetraphosphate (Ap4A) HIT family hydrolase
MTTDAKCFMCQDPMFTEKGSQYPRKIADLGVSTAIMNKDWQFFRGSSILVYRGHVTELHQLPPEEQHRYVDDASRLAQALEKTFPDIKLNHGLFGNTVPHLHWHMVVRRATDPEPKKTIWESEFPKLQPSDEDFESIAAEIRRNL